MSFAQTVNMAESSNGLDNISIRSYRTYTSMSNSIIFNNSNSHRNKFRNLSSTVAGVNKDNVYYEHMNYTNSDRKHSVNKDPNNVKDDIISLLKSTTSHKKDDVKHEKQPANTIDSDDLVNRAENTHKTQKEVKPQISADVTQSQHSSSVADDYLIFLTNGKLIYSSLLDYYNTDRLESDILLEISVLTLLLDTLDYNIITLSKSTDNSSIHFYYNTITPNINIIYRYKGSNSSIGQKVNLKELDKLLVNKIFQFENLKKRLTKFEGLDLRYDLDFKKLTVLNNWVKAQQSKTS